MEFALRIMKLIDALPRSIKGKAISAQIIRSGMSVAANYRSACKARSKAEFVSRLGIVEEEADETVLWMELIVRGGLLPEKRVSDLIREGRELVAIMAASRKSARG